MRTEPRAERRLDVLRALVRAYITLGEPVASKSLSGHRGCEVSSATIRHVMAELEEMGYVSQPHHSAGRVPTESGLRVYAELVLGDWRAGGTDAVQFALPRALVERVNDIPEFLAEVSRTLSRLCHGMGVVLHSRMAQARLLHAQFLRLGPRRVVAMIVDETGGVADTIVRLDEDIEQGELDRIACYLLNRFGGWTLQDVHRLLESELRSERELYDAVRQSWLRLALAGLEPSVVSVEVYLGGAAHCVESPEFGRLEPLRRLLEAYEEKDRMARLLRSCLDHGDLGVRVGAAGAPSASATDGIPGLAIVAAVVTDGDCAVGSLGVVGPARMEYEKVIPIVDGMSRELSRMLSRGEAEF